jgi:hypothetical protein
VVEQLCVPGVAGTRAKGNVAISKKEVSSESNQSAAALAVVARFVRDYWPQLLAISVAVIAPCLWHPRIEAGDLPSHLYNAWLTHLIKAGQAPGLWLAQRWNNVLFDFELSWLGNIVGWGSAEKVAVSAAVLIFFWGAFALVCAMTRHVPWFVLPCLAMVAYGWTFEMGFMNCYISLGLAFLGLAILVRGRGWEQGLAALLVPLIWLAHPLGLALLATVGAYIVLAERLPRHHVYLFVTSILLLLGLHLFIRVHYSGSGVDWKYGPPFVHDGTDQLLLYGPKYMLPARLFRAFLWACLLFDVMRRRHTARWWSAYVLPSELYALISLGALLLPTGIDTRIFHRMGFLSIGFLTERLTSVSAILLCCLLGAMKPRKWHLISFAMIAALFFFVLYNDTATINRMEAQLDRKVGEIPPGKRVVATIVTLPGRVFTHHIVDRACIGRCFSYNNFEPSTGQFRVRANPGNPFVLADMQSAGAAQVGDYVVRSRDLPLFDIYQCDSSITALCVREAAAGDRTSSPLWKDGNGWFPQFNAALLLVDISPGPVILGGLYTRRWLMARLQPARA